MRSTGRRSGTVVEAALWEGEYRTETMVKKDKGKAIPVTSREGP
jgi:hypothetical protein